MKAVEVRDGAVRLRNDHPEPQRAEGEVVVRVLRAGVCETDLQLMQGYMGFAGVLGHEFVGVAETGRYAGRRVVGEINCSCRRCELCLAGLGNHCPRRSVLGILNRDGAFAERLTLPERNLHLVPGEVDDDAAVFTEPLAAAFQIPTQIELRRDQRVIVLGAGRLGNLCAQVLSAAVVSLTVVGKHDSKLARLRELGVDVCRLDELPAERKADVVVDCTGSPSGLPTALRCVRPRGTVVLKTTIAGEQGLSLAPFVIDEITLVGSRCGPFDRALQALRDGEVAVSPLVSARFPLSEGLAALDAASSESAMKVLIDVAEE